MEYELAARLRDDLGALNKALEKNAVVLADKTDADVFALADDELEAAVQVFFVRGGRIRGQRGWVVEKESEDVPELMGHLLQQVYGDQAQDSPDQVPREVLVPIVPAESEAAGRLAGHPPRPPVDLRVPQRGDKRALMETVRRNAEQSLARHKVRPGRRPHRPQPGPPGAPGGPRAARRAAADRVLRRQPRPGHQRRRVDGRLRGRPRAQVRVPPVRRPGRLRAYRARRHPDVDDTAAMHEVLTRRFQRYLDEREHSAEIELGPAIEDDADGMPTSTARSTRSPGGRASSPTRPTSSSSTAACRRSTRRKRVLDELGIEDVSLVGLAKRLEEVWVPGQDFPLILPRTSEGLYLLQRVRDEAHRFAITFHRQRRSKAMTTSRPRRHPGSRRGASQGAAARSSGRSSGCARRRSRRSPPSRASDRSWPRPSRRGWRRAARQRPSRPLT